jgi:hypothetical protein
MRLLASAIIVVALCAGASAVVAQAPAEPESGPAESADTESTNLAVVALIVVLAIGGAGWFFLKIERRATRAHGPSTR